MWKVVENWDGEDFRKQQEESGSEVKASVQSYDENRASGT